MSHIAKIEIEVKDLAILKRACARLGFEFRENQTTFTWFGNYLGDSPLPEGVNQNDLGKCNHAISIPEARYEIGVVSKGQGYDLVWDYWSTGGLQAAIGQNGGRLRQAYAAEKAILEARRKGYRVTEQTTENGGIRLRIAVNQ